MLNHGCVALVDDDDFERVNQFRWHITDTKNEKYTRYAVRTVRYGPRKEGKQKRILMHRFILGVDSPIDHANGNGLDNRKSNLRPCTVNENNTNTRMRCTNHSGYRGVSFDPDTGAWISQIRINGKEVYLGLFDYPVDAAIVYDCAARKYHCEFATTNFEQISKEDENRALEKRRKTGITSKYRGVWLHKPSGKWVSRVIVRGHAIRLGTFSNEIDAAVAYDKKNKELGRLCRLNFPMLTDDELESLRNN